jgi:hypothetical protein
MCLVIKSNATVKVLSSPELLYIISEMHTNIVDSPRNDYISMFNGRLDKLVERWLNVLCVLLSKCKAYWRREKIHANLEDAFNCSTTLCHISLYYNQYVTIS